MEGSDEVENEDVIGDEGEVMDLSDLEVDFGGSDDGEVEEIEAASMDYGREVCLEILGDSSQNHHNLFFDLFDPLFGRVKQSRLLRNNLFLSKLHCETIFNGHDGCINTLDFNSDGSLLCSGSDDTQLLIWSYDDWEHVGTISPGHTENIFCAQFRGGSEFVASCDRGGIVAWSSVQQEMAVNLFECNRGANEVRRIAQDDSYVCYCAADNAAIYRADFREKHPRCPSAEECTNCVVRLPGEQFLYSVEQSGFRLFAGGSRGVVSVVDVRNPSRAAEEMVLSEQQQMKYVTGMCFAEDGRELLVSLGGRRAEIVMVRSDDGTEVRRFRGHINSATVKGVRFGAAQDTVLSGSDCGNAFAWERSTGRLVGWFAGDEEICNVVEQRPGEISFACAGLSSTVKIINPIADVDQINSAETRELLVHNLATADMEENNDDIGCPVQ